MIKEEILNLTGNKNEVLTEGVKYFKFSKRFDNLITKAAKSKNPNKKDFIKVMKIARDDFRKAEIEYDLGNKKQAKQTYQTAKVKNTFAVKKLLSSEMKSFILRAGLFGGFSVIMFLLTKGAIDFKESGKLDSILSNMESSSKDIVRELQYLGKEKDVEYYNRKWTEIGKRSLATAKEIANDASKKAPDLINKTVSELKANLGEEVLTEGVKFFKMSNRLNKEIISLKKKDPSNDKMVALLKSIRKDFTEAEETFIEDKEKGKFLYKEALLKHEGSLNRILLERKIDRKTKIILLNILGYALVIGLSAGASAYINNLKIEEINKTNNLNIENLLDQFMGSDSVKYNG